MEIRDLRDWSVFAIAIVVPAVGGIFLLSAELRRSPDIVQIAFAILLVLAILAAGIAFLFWRGRRALSDRLGLVEFRQRDQAPPIHTVYQSIQRFYRWHGLSAVNELVGQTEVQSAISKRSAHGAEYAFVLADPRDWIRVKEQKRWENNATRPIEKLIENIQGSQKVLGDLQASGARVSLMSAARLSSFRIVEVDGERIEVAHYDRDGCGYSGVFLVLKKPKKGDGMLFEWFKRAADLERKNAVLDQLYDAIFGLLGAGSSATDIVRTVMTDVRYEQLRRKFDSHFDWKLNEEDVAKSVEYIAHRVRTAT